MYESDRTATPDKTRAKKTDSYILNRDKSQNQVSGLTCQWVAIQPQTYNRGEGKGQKAAFKRAEVGPAGTEQKQSAERGARQAPGLLVTGTAVGLGLGRVC